MKHMVEPTKVPISLRNNKQWREGYSDNLEGKIYYKHPSLEWRLGWLCAEEDTLILSMDHLP